MKQTNICPKCQSTDVTRIKAFKGTSNSSMIQLTKWGTHFAYFDRYLCLNCGFTEEYVRLDDSSLQKWILEQRENNSLDSDFV
jgi:predicted nucleic-acid-binding Zn-ribbon protein